ncbi:dipeptide ABC transporter ATP-binding protein [Bosea sp. NPDC055594]
MSEPATTETVLSIDQLNITYDLGALRIKAVQELSLTLRAGEILGLVGESGSGKSSLGYAVLGHLGSAGKATGGLRFRGEDLLSLSPVEWARLRGRRIGMVYQEPQTALNPAYTVGEQIAEGLRHHFSLARTAARERALDWLKQVHLPDPERIYERYPHQLSGGQLQRAVIAMAFALEPELLIMDEPTTGLDVTTQAVILDLVRDLRAKTGVAILYVSHDLGVVADICDRVLVLYRGRMVEEGDAAAVLRQPREPYTQRLVAAIPDLYRRHSFEPIRAEAEAGGAEILIEPPSERRYLPPAPTERPAATAILDIRELQRVYRSRGNATVACKDVSFDIRRGECVALIGESGSGKSTVAKCVLGLEKPDGGAIVFDGAPCPKGVHDRPLSLRRRLQIVFQNPDGSLNGRRTVGETLCRPLLIHGRARSTAEAGALARELLTSVDLPHAFFERYPHELSGGQKQRVAIARALATEPDLIVCDEAVSALDVSVQGTILDLCRRLQAERGLAFLFITHDLGVVRQIADRAVVMLKGEICHAGGVESLFEDDAHPYVKALLAAVPGKTLDALPQGRTAPQFVLSE